jgi:ketosteroid isomerase-like protein
VSTWIADYLDAWNSHDGNKVASFMTDDAVYEDLAVGQVHEGKAAITAFVQRTDVFSPDCEFVSVSRLSPCSETSQTRRGALAAAGGMTD